MADATDRGWVPFAVVGVLLLVSASTLAATTRTRPSATAEPAAERAIERAESAVVAALRRAAAAAARDAAARPLVVPADTPAGRELASTDPFRAGLELRLSRAFRDPLGHLDRRVGDVHVTARLPHRPVGTAASVGAALDRVDTERVGPNASVFRATVRNVTLVVTRGGRTLDRVRLSLTVVVGLPVFALHDRATRFERRLDRGPLEPGFARRLTARLYAATWARGTAQYAGAPVVNVLGTRHVELLTNGALLATQRSTLGGVDPRAPSALHEATARVAAADVTGGVREAVVRSNHTLPAGLRSVERGHPADRRQLVSVGGTAERALANLTRGGLERVFAATYTAMARTRATVERRSHTVGGDSRPGPGWSLADRTVRTDWASQPADGAVEPPPGRTGWRSVATATRLVVRTRTTTRVWVDDGRRRRSERTARTTFVVGLRHELRPSRPAPAPPRPVRRAFDRAASPVGGPNLADARSTAVDRFQSRAGRLATRAVRDGVNGTLRHRGRVPATLRERVVTDLVSLHRRVRNVSVSVERGSLATLSVSPARRLADRLRERRAVLVDAPGRYDHVAEKARVAARAAYLDRVVTALDRQAARHRTVADRLDGALRAAGVGGLNRLRRLVDVRRRPADTRTAETTGRFGTWRRGVSTAPVYLSTSVSASDSPLATRNLNLAVPFADAGDTLAETLFGGRRRVRLPTAAGTLRSADRVAERSENGSLMRATGRLRGAVNDSVHRVFGRLVDTLRRRGVARGTRRVAVTSALARFDSPAARALALSNGSVVPRVTATVADREPGFRDPARRLALRAALNATLTRALRSERVRVAERRVDGPTRRLRWVAREATRELTGRALETGASRVRDRLRGPLGAVSAGVPVTPVPGYWHATTNVWHVTVRGRYDRVELRAGTGRPPAGTLTYVRDGGAAELDVDGDGTPERLGRAERVSFDVSTTVVVAVPPGPRGVGDTDGNADERSAGWPGPSREPGHGPTNETTYPPPS